MIVEATAPCRIDLAGGTLDIHPLFLFLDGGVTVNAAVDLTSRATVETRGDASVHLRSADTGAALEAPGTESLPTEGPLGLVARVVKFYAPRTGVNVETHNAAPHGSGLGASSSLLIALSGALDKLNGTGFTYDEFVDYGASVEAQCIGIPTGKQDYYAALMGGLNAIWFEVKGNRVESLVADEEGLSWFEERIVLTFTGESHFSGTSNWNMLKAYIDDVGNNRESMMNIKETALAMREAASSRDFGAFAELVDREWLNRRRLAEGVSTPRIELLMSAAKKAGALSSKICGAGGGGCMITVIEPGSRAAVAEALEKLDARVLPFKIARQGLQVSVSSP
jgi:D-glycero-alpha-D-manno-heptose-7-phosphate kinase